MQSLLVVAVDIFREVCLKSTEHDRHYYGFWDLCGEEEAAIEILIESGYCATEKEARKKIIEEDDATAEFIEKVWSEQNDEDFAAMHDERFWEWEEEEKINDYFRGY